MNFELMTISALKFLKVFLLILLFLDIKAFAQSKVFKGKVETGKSIALADAYIKIFSPTNSTNPTVTRTSDKNGLFTIDNLGPADYFLIEISHTSTFTYKGRFSFKNTTDSLYVFLLQEKINILNGVDVVGRRPLISRKNDKLIVNVEGNDALQGKNFNQILQYAPGIQVMNNEIFINGVSGVRIYLDGQPLKMTGNALKNYLANINAGELKNIEILGTPSSEFSAEGLGGIININIKKTTVDGITGYLGGQQSFGLGRYPSTSPYANINLKKDKIQLSAKYSYQVRKEYFTDEQFRTLISGTSFSSETERITRGNQTNLNLGLAYDVDARQNISINYNGNYATEKESSLSEALIKNTGPTNTVRSAGQFNNISKVGYHNFGINYRLYTDSLKSRLSVNGDFTTNSKKESSEIESSFRDDLNNLLSDTLYNFIFPSHSRIYTGDIKYLKVFKGGHELNFGGRISKSYINTDNSIELFTGNGFFTDPKSSFNYLYDEMITAGFIEGSGKFLNLNYRLGLRGEATDILTSLHSLGNQMDNQRKYFNIFPSIYFGRDLDQKKYYNLSLTYNRRIARPSYSTLNPYIFYVDNNTISTGNPNLRPSFADNLQLTFTLKNRYNLSLLYSNLSCQIQRIVSVDQSDILYQTWENVGNTRLYNVNLSAPFDITKFWTTNNSLLLQFKQVTGDQYQIQKGTFVFQNSNDFEINKTLSLSLSTYYTPRSIYANTITKGYGDISAGISKKTLKNKLAINVNLEDIFFSSNPHITSYYNNQAITRNPKFQTRKLYFSLRYNFRSGKAFKKSTYEKSSADESGRL
ncbi:TonB-dependent receptor [Pedobacter sp. HDW13]|uniref:outer membrane beta-barrel protein n=1 Tax=Pedobacter sp. HDW13 TaxID=2714940 RepID=UPI0014092FC9|nr:outer membrane beta-barrel protein [Pedobacter sp. HDW13]QIL40012.1 TonB-dependent receptor [Pedobacter sp. HDW13]